jgi:hypothetical protein
MLLPPTVCSVLALLQQTYPFETAASTGSHCRQCCSALGIKTLGGFVDSVCLVVWCGGVVCVLQGVVRAGMMTLPSREHFMASIGTAHVSLVRSRTQPANS